MSGIELSPRRHLGRAEVMALIAWVSASAALGSDLYPARAAALFAFLVGLVVVVTLRAAITFGLATAAFGAVLFSAVHLILSATPADPRLGHLDLPSLLTRPTSRQGGMWASTIVAVVVLMVSSLLADVVSTAVAHLARGEAAPEPSPAPRLEGREAGLLKAEWELTRAATYQRHLTLGLVGPDPGGAVAMDALDRLLSDTFTAFDVVCAYGPQERLIVMPEESSERVAAGAEHLCEIATVRLGRPVRMSVAGFPEDGATLPELLQQLDQRLGRCREEGATVNAGQVLPRPEAVGTPEPPASPAPEAAPDHPTPGLGPPPGAEEIPADGEPTTAEVEVLDPFEPPADLGEVAEGEEVAEQLRTLLQDPWSALEATEEETDRGLADPSTTMAHGPQDMARQPRTEPSTTPAG